MPRQKSAPPCPDVLLLFDIDGTLLTSKNAGAHAMTSAGRSCVAGHFSVEGFNLGGRLDPSIIGDAIEAAGASLDLANDMRLAYASHLQSLLDGGHPVTPLPGVFDLLKACNARPHWTLGLLTGNFPETGRMKLAAAGIDVGDFGVCVWGDDGPTRNHLPDIAIRRTPNSDPARTVVIGDTLRDIQCARACGCKVIATATGPVSKAELACGQPDLLLDDLADTGTVLAWLERMSA